MKTINKDKKGRNLKEGEYQMPDGRYRYRYTDASGNRKSIYSWRLVITDKTPKGKKETPSLRQLEDELVKDKIDGIMNNDCTLNELFDKYMNINSALTLTTKSNYISMWEKNIRKLPLANTSVKDIKKSDISLLFSSFQTEKKFAITTIQLYQNILFPTFKVAVDDNIIRTNPCQDAMKKLKQGSVTKEKEPLSIEEQKALLQFLKVDTFYDHYYPMIVFFLSTGARMSEMLGLTWDDIDFEEGIIHLTHQAIYRRINGKVQWICAKLKWARTKDQCTRSIPITEDVLEILKELKEKNYYHSFYSEFRVNTIERDVLDFGLKEHYNNFVFINSEGNLSTPASINRTLIGIVTRYNKLKEDTDITLPLFSAHILRHTFATRNAENGMDIKVLQSLMGHKNIAVTMDVYNYVSKERVKLEVKRVSTPLLGI